MHRTILRFGAVALAAILPLTACEDSFTGSEVGHLTILLTDEPGDFHAAVVTIEGVYLQGSGGEDGGRFWLRTDPVTTDLLTLQNDVLELVEDAEVPSGVWAQLRFVISDGFIEVEGEDGETRVYASSEGYSEEHHEDGRPRDGVLQMPSFAQSGLKVNLPGGAVEVTGGQTVLLADFNVARSFGRQAGESGMWVMDPVVHAVEFTLSSSITVTLATEEDVELPGDVSAGDFAVHLEDGDGNTREAAFEENDGTWTASFRHLLPGVTWELGLIVPEDLEVEVDVDLPTEVVTASGADVEVHLVITGVGEDDGS